MDSILHSTYPAIYIQRALAIICKYQPLVIWGGIICGSYYPTPFVAYIVFFEIQNVYIYMYYIAHFFAFSTANCIELFQYKTDFVVFAVSFSVPCQ